MTFLCVLFLGLSLDEAMGPSVHSLSLSKLMSTLSALETKSLSGALSVAGALGAVLRFLTNVELACPT